ncbi:MAG: DUF2399 domain-containing protein [Cytophagales bacterium]|nr:MAG: DUF2399 domain-containing protein [Cytophagales bacterium]
MISLTDLRRKALAQYETVLRAHLTGNDPFPMPIRAAKTLAHRTDPDAVLEQQRDLLLHSKNKTGQGYTLTLKTNPNTRQSEIRQIAFEELSDYLNFTQKEAEYEAFVSDVERIRTTSPALVDLLTKSPRLVVEQAGNWSHLLVVTGYFERNPRPNQYVRNLPLPLPTKFIETNRPVLRLLLDHLIPDNLNPDETDFYRRFHLSVEEPLVKIRFLDERLRLHPALSHLSVWLTEFRSLNLPGSQVFIIENLTTFLSFPTIPDSLVIWGAGFAVTQLANTDWLAQKQLHYWGDLDAHGFQMLSLFRERYSTATSLLMDQATFEAHRSLLVTGEQVPVDTLSNLTDEEQALFQLLNRNGWRVEQERLEVEWVRENIV